MTLLINLLMNLLVNLSPNSFQIVIYEHFKFVFVYIYMVVYVHAWFFLCSLVCLFLFGCLDTIC